MKKWLNILLIILLGLALTLFFIRLFSERQIDDVTPGIPCEKSLLEKSDIYYVIPIFDNPDIKYTDGPTNISNMTQWCKEIKGYGKEIAMHGVYHTYKEFGVRRTEDYVGAGKSAFEKCFGYLPKRFKPPQLAWTKKNDWMKGEMEIDLNWNQLFHKVYHCKDTGILPNWIIDII